MAEQEYTERPVPTDSEQPQMSEVATLGNIFIEPGRTFEDLKRKPRFIMAGVIVSLLIAGYAWGLYYKVGDAGMRDFTSEQLDKNPQTASLQGEARKSAIDMSLMIQTGVRYAVPVFVFISLFIGGLIYFAGAKAFGGSGGYMHALSVWVYSSLPPTVVGMIANFIVLAFKSTDDISIGASQRGVLHANPSILVDGATHPVLATFLATFDVFFIWGWILAAIGLRVTNRLSSGAAWGVVILLAVIGTLFRLGMAFLGGNPA
jgi:hypothetical protein